MGSHTGRVRKCLAEVGQIIIRQGIRIITIIQRPVTLRLPRILARCYELDGDEHTRSGIVGVAVMVIGGDDQSYGSAGTCVTCGVAWCGGSSGYFGNSLSTSCAQ